MSYPYPDDTGGERRLQELKPRINAEDRAVREAVRSTFEHALHCGELLEQAKALAGHGNWGRWRDDNFEGSAATAQLYQQLWRNRELLVDPETERVRDLSLREARKIISELPEGDDSESEPSEESSEEEAKKRGSNKGPGKPGRCDLPAAEIYGVDDLPVPESKVKAALGDGQALALRSDASSGAERALEAAKSCLEDVVRQAWAAGHDVRLALLFAANVSGLERGLPAVERAVAAEADEEPTEAEVARHQARELGDADGAEPTLYKIIELRGGIDPRRSKLREEWRQVNNKYKRKGGLPPDVMAAQIAYDRPEIGVREERDLIDKLAS